MHQTSETYKRILQTPYKVDWWTVINGVLYDKSQLISARTSIDIFTNGSGPVIGECISGQLDLALLVPSSYIPKMAEIRLFCKIYNATEESEAIPKGVYFISTRKEEVDERGLNILELHCYDAMMKFNIPISLDTFWPKKDRDFLEEACSKIGVELDERTYNFVSRNYYIPAWGFYESTSAALNHYNEVDESRSITYKDAIGYIATLYASNAVMSDEGKLRFIGINTLSNVIIPPF